MRATAAALMSGVISLAGYGLGSPVIGLINDVGQVVMASHGATQRRARENCPVAQPRVVLLASLLWLSIARNIHE
jgi:hypothetical protein